MKRPYKILVVTILQSGLTQENPETRFLVDVYCSKQGFIVETGFLCVSPNNVFLLYQIQIISYRGHCDGNSVEGRNLSGFRDCFLSSQ